MNSLHIGQNRPRSVWLTASVCLRVCHEEVSASQTRLFGDAANQFIVRSTYANYLLLTSWRR